MSYLLERREIKRCLNPTAMGSAFSVCGVNYTNVVSIVVGGGVYREKTVAGHFRVAGKGSRIDQCPTRVEMVGVLTDTYSEDLKGEAAKLAPQLKRLKGCLVIIDGHGLGVAFAKYLECHGVANIVFSSWGETPREESNKARFHNRRAQCSVHAAEAIQDGRVALAMEYQAELLDQGARLPFHLDESARFHMSTKETMRALGIPSPDLFETVCQAFLEGVDGL